MIPSRTYKNAGWNGWADWLGKEKNANMPLSQRQLATSVISDDPIERPERGGRVPRWQPYRVAGPVQGTLDCHPVGKKVGERVLGLNKQIEERAAGQTRRAVQLRQLTKNAWCRFKSEEVIHL